MAALLRSARLFKSSPVPLLQITGANIHGSALSRLCTGALVGRGVRLNATQGSSSLGVNRFTWPLATVRHFEVAPKQQGVPKDEASLVVPNRQAQHFDSALTQLDTSVRRTGRITRSLLMNIFHDCCRSGYPSGNLALLLLRSCGTLLAELLPSERTDIAHQIWDKLQELGVAYDVSHYNALLKVYLQNEFKFSPTEFLAKMEAANVPPNRVTFQRLVAAYCLEGDIEGASKILGLMKSKDLPITEAVFNSLITGHARAGDMESAKNILSVMSGAGIEPGPDSYLALLNAHAERGEMESIRERVEAISKGDVTLLDRDFMQVLFTLAKAGYSQHVPEILNLMRHEPGYVADGMNVCLRLLTQGIEDTAFTFLKTFPVADRDLPNLGHFFLRHCVNTNMPLEKLQKYCKKLKDANLHSTPFQFTLQCALEAKNADMAMELMKVMKEEDLPIRPHYFWPLLAQYQKDNNEQGAVTVLKNMEALGVQADLETLRTYVLPSFSNSERARTALQEAGCAVDPISLHVAQIRTLAVNGKLDEVFTILSSPTLPPIDLIAFRGSLIMAFRSSSDVESMAKITELLFRDQRFCSNLKQPMEVAFSFLYTLIEGMSRTEIQAQEEKLRQFFHLLKSMDLTIPLRYYKGIRNLPNTSHVPELVQDVLELVDGEEKLPPSEMPQKAAGGRVLYCEDKLRQVKAAGEPLGNVLLQLILAHCAEENLTKALALKTEYEADMSVRCYAVLIDLCCRHDNMEEAVKLKNELSHKDPTAVMDAFKYLRLVTVLSQHGKLEEALDIMKEMKEKEVPMHDGHQAALYRLLNEMALSGDQTGLLRLQEAIFSLGLAKPSILLCSPQVTLHLEKSDYAAALDTVMACMKQYGLLPRFHEVLCALIETGDTDLLQKAMDTVSSSWGERSMLYDLFFAFLNTGKYKEARKVIETPGLTARPGRLHWFAEKCIFNNQMEVLENLVDITAKLFECDRDDMYHYLLRLCSEQNDWRKAEAVWTKMQEENVIPRERTLLLLASVLKNNGQEVPFELPKVWYEDAAAVAPKKPPPEPKTPVSPPGPATKGHYEREISALCKKDQIKEAFKLLKEAEKSQITMDPSLYNFLIKAMLSKGNMTEAMMVRDIAVSRINGFYFSEPAHSLLIITQVKMGQIKDAQATFKEMILAKQVPSQLSVTRLVQGLSSLGDVQGIQEVENTIKGLGSTLNLSRMLFVNNIALAHIKSGNMQAAVEGLEALFTPGCELVEDGPQLASSISYIFRRIISEGNQDALDTLSAMAERLANQFSSYRPASDLFLEYLDFERVEEAKFLLERCAGIAEQKQTMVSFMAKLSKKAGQANKLKTLHELVPDFVEKSSYYSYLIKCYAMDDNLPSAKAVYQQMQDEGFSVDELTLKRLAGLYKDAGETVPFVEPLESFRFYAEKIKQGLKSQSSAEEA